MSEMYHDTCFTCGIEFCYPMERYEELLKSKKSFYCPKGHCQHFTGKSELQKAKDRITRLLSHIEEQDKSIEFWRVKTNDYRRSVIALKGHLTRLRKDEILI